METSFEKLLAHLIEAQVEFLLVGGLAVALNGYPRMTEDVDIWIDPAPANVQKLISCLSSYGEGYGGQLDVSDFSNEPGAIRINESFPIDIFVQMNGIQYHDILPHKKIYTATDLSIPYVNAAGLIKIKSGSHREKDLLDISVLKDKL
ncbi:MAG: hypothetical protein KTR33_05595 [Gammaproteobacteria bacterium]|nr:hypothetical protein [Gammaproteobacteria bacterium]